MVSGGLIHYKETDDTGPLSITVSSCELDDVLAQNEAATTDPAYGGVIYIDSPYTTADSDVTITGVTATNFEAYTQGGFLWIGDYQGTVEIKGSSSFGDFKATSEGSFMYSESSALALSVEGSTFECTTAITNTYCD